MNYEGEWRSSPGRGDELMRESGDDALAQQPASRFFSRAHLVTAEVWSIAGLTTYPLREIKRESERRLSRCDPA